MPHLPSNSLRMLQLSSLPSFLLLSVLMTVTNIIVMIQTIVTDPVFTVVVTVVCFVGQGRCLREEEARGGRAGTCPSRGTGEEERGGAGCSAC